MRKGWKSKSEEGIEWGGEKEWKSWSEEGMEELGRGRDGMRRAMRREEMGGGTRWKLNYPNKYKIHINIK